MKNTETSKLPSHDSGVSEESSTESHLESKEVADPPREIARHKVLVENTAQAVDKHLRRLIQEESRFRNRWIWELLQNARDASTSKGVDVWIVKRPDHLLFRHNGVPFTDEAIAHLIYHGSTKYDLSDSENIGQFGTGFLTTHLISRTVTVSGSMADGQRFRFELNRQGNGAPELNAAMDASWVSFEHSLNSGVGTYPEDFTTEYEYPLVDTRTLS